MPKKQTKRERQQAIKLEALRRVQCTLRYVRAMEPELSELQVGEIAASILQMLAGIS